MMQAPELEPLDPDLTVPGYKDNDRLNEAMVSPLCTEPQNFCMTQTGSCGKLDFFC